MKLELPPVCSLATILLTFSSLCNAMIPLPPFKKLKANYPGYKHHGGYYSNKKFVRLIQVKSENLLHDTSALRMSYAFNKVGGVHSLGKKMIRLSKFGKDSIPGRDNMQYLFHPIAYGPFMADRYGYPSVSKVQKTDPIDTKKSFYGKQGILRVLTYTKEGNVPKGHVALWDCNHFHQTKDWISGHSLISVEFWESPDSDCSQMNEVKQRNTKSSTGTTFPTIEWKPHAEITNEHNLAKKLGMNPYMKKIYRTYYKHKNFKMPHDHRHNQDLKRPHRHGHMSRNMASTRT